MVILATLLAVVLAFALSVRLLPNFWIGFCTTFLRVTIATRTDHASAARIRDMVDFAMKEGMVEQGRRMRAREKA